MSGSAANANVQPVATSRPLTGLLVCQFFGAFNDNAWKMVVTLLAMRAALNAAGDDPTRAQEAQQMYAAMGFVVFTLPLMLVSLPASVIADRVSKRTVIVAMKGLEVVLMAAGTLSLMIAPSSWWVPMAVLGAMGVQSALFSPAKYGILPELLDHEHLSRGNGLLEMWTFIAIVAGMGGGGMLLDAMGDRSWLAAAPLTGLAIVGLVAAFRVPRVPAARSEGAMVETVREAVRIIRGDRVLYLAVAGSVFYWGIASLLGQDILVYTKSITSHLENSDTLSGVPLAVLGLGVGIGSVIAGRLSGGKVEYGLIPMGGLGMSAAALTLGGLAPGFAGTTGLMLVLGMCGGLVVVPLNAILQWRSPADRRGALIAVANVAVFGGTLAGSLIGYYLAMRGLNARMILVVAALTVVAGTAWAVWLLPQALARFVLVLLTHTFYRLKISGRANVPETGPALLAPNHVTFLDWLFLVVSLDRPVRFIVDAHYYNNRWFGPIMRAYRAIPISSTGGPRVILRALRDAGKYLDEGDLVCIFPEGQLTRTGMILPFRRGIGRIVKGRTAPIIPVHIDGAWGSIFSFKSGRFLTKLPRQIPYRMSVSFGEALPTDTPLWRVRAAMQELGCRAWAERQALRPAVHRSFIRSVRGKPNRFALGDEIRPSVSGLRALAGAVALGKRLRGRWANQQRVGILLPPSVAGAMVNIAAAIAGKTSVNLNYTSGPGAMTFAAQQAGLSTVVTSLRFLEKAKLELPKGVAPLYVEDLAKNITRGERLFALFLARWAPSRWLERYCGALKAPTIEDELTIIFSSGSTGDPKGVVLTHANVDSNVEGVAQVFPVEAKDKMLGILPLFHSFGYMTLWLAANHGVGIVCHPNPLDADAVGRLVEQNRLTILIATPTFLQLYLRRCSPGAFGSLRVVLTGAEKLPDRLVEAFEGKFGIRPIEGYGATECSPVIAVSTLDVRYEGVYQAGSRRGYVGQPLPGVSVRVVDPDTWQPLGPDEPGMLLVHGPNVMRGYLGRDDLTAKAMRDGWYVTGDIALIDPDGFIKITDRLSRFSKIGGEMVPHGKVEDALHEAAGLQVQMFAVTAVPDEKKGERLAVLHTWDPKRIADLPKQLTEMGLPNLFVPRADQFVKVDALPFLGTGKLDLRKVKQVALESLGG